MKLISLNTWGGKIYQPLMDFIKKNAQTTDIFCFQEVFSTTSNVKLTHERRTNLYEEFAKALPNHQGYFAPSLKNFILFNRFEIIKTIFPLYFGLAIFVRKQLNISASGDFFLLGKRFIYNPDDIDSLPRNAQYLTFSKYGENFTIVNLHGIWLKEGKKDSPSRLEQSERINDFLNQQEEKKILCGDFNLRLDTKSIKILEEKMINLIKEYSIPTTRNVHFPGDEKYADYTFVSSGINVESFKVPKVEISDHLPMLLQFS